MRTFTRHALACLILVLGQHFICAQPVDLGVASSFAVFTAAGAFSNDGTTMVTGDIGTNVGAFTGFPPGIVIGSIHVADVISAQAATDVALAYGQLSAMTCGAVLGTTLGGGQILAPNIYCLGAASVLNGDLILDGGCNPDAIFIFQIDGALATSTFSNVILTNSASLCNVYWQVNGAVTLGPSSVFRGNIVAGGAIHLLDGASLFGRALTTAGAIDMHTNVVDRDMMPTASILTAAGATTFCEGGSVTLNGNCGGTWNNGATTTSITVSVSGNYSVTTTNSCGSAVSNVIIVTVNPLPVCFITGNLTMCEGQSTVLCTTAGLASYLWSTGATINCITVSVAGTYSVTITDANGCSSSCSQTVTVNPIPFCSITGDQVLCEGQSTDLCAPAGMAGYEWGTTETTNCINVYISGINTVTITDANGCSNSCSQTVLVNPAPNCGMFGPIYICEGQSAEICTAAGFSSYLWSTGETINCITVNATGTYSVTVTDANGCSSDCSHPVTVTPPPNCAITGNLSICPGQSTVLCTTAGLASYLWSTGETLNCISVNAVGVYTVTVTDVNGCSNICSETVILNTGNGTPSILCPIDITLECNQDPSPANTGFAVALDNCGASLPVNFSDVVGTLACPQNSTITRTWTATDGSGNVMSCVQNITLEDTTPPVVTCPVVVSPIPCGSTPSFGPATAIDACDGTADITFLDVTISGACGQGYSVTRTWTAIDDCGNSAQCSSTIVVQGSLPPVIICPVVVSPIECGETITFNAPTVIESCNGATILTYVDDFVPGQCPQEFIYTRTWTATDVCGNSAQCSNTIVVQDNTAPVITCPVVVSPIVCGSTPSFGTPTAIDACDALVDITFSDITTSGGCGQGYSVTRTWLATDDCGNTAQCSSTIVVQGSAALAILCPSVVSPIECGITPSFGAPTVTESCNGIVVVTFSDTTVPGLCPQAYSVTRTWTATDICGNSAQCSSTIVVQDNTAPVINCPVVVSPIQCGVTPNFGTPTATDACDATVTITFLDVTLPGLCPQAYSVTRTWTATDDCGNSAQCSATIAVQDNTAPIINCPSVVSPIQCGVTPNFGTPTATDACDATVTITFLDVTLPGLCPQAYSVTRTWTATDDCGNSAQCSATIAVQDNTAPIINCPVVVSPIQCGVAPNFGTPTATDACDATVTITFLDVTLPGLCPQAYSVTRTWTATDDCGNSAQCSATIVVQDNTAPIINCPAVVSPIQCGVTPNFGTPTATDACDATVTITFLDVTLPGLCPQANSVTRTWTATDDCGNSAQCSATIVVQDNTAPIINCPSVVSPIQCGVTPNFGTPTATDACDATVTITFLDVTLPGLCPQAYSVTRTWTATDDCGNSAQCSATIVVQDNTAPIINCPAVVSPIQCGVTPNFGTPTATDACDATVTITFLDVTLPGLCPQAYSVTRTWTATDDCGNSAQCSATIVVQDNTAPIINCPAVVSPIQCGVAPNFGTPTATDACDATVTITFLDVTLPGLCPQAYSVTRTWTATDDCGNSAQCSATIVVQDNTAPIINCPSVVSPIQCGVAPNFGTPTATDACDATVTITFLDVTLPGLCPQAYSVTRTWTATDDCGNSAQCSATIVVQDNTAPIINCPAVVSPIQCGVTPNFGTPTALDACDVSVTITFLDVTLPGLCPQAYSVTRTWTATDDCGNSAQCSATIVVQDNTAPIINCPAVVSPIQCGVAPNFGTPTATDACDATVTITFLDVTLPGLCPQSYSVTRTWTATDDCGNSAQCSATIVVQDNTAPIITCPVVVSPLQCNETPNFGTPTATDACDATVTVTFFDVILPGLCPQAYSVTRTWTATDDCGNSAQCSATIVVQDNTAPIINCPAVVSPIQCGVTPNFGTPTATDACDAAVTITFTDITLPGLCPQAYSVTRTWTATDECGNSAQCSVTIVVQDNTAPIINCPVVVSPIQCGVAPNFGTPTATDACDATVTITFLDVTLPGLCPQAYSVTRTWTATDDCGNSAQCSATIVVQDNTAPIINCPAVVSPIQCGAAPVFGLATATDACDATVTITFIDVTVPGICPQSYTVTRTWTATDDCGNSAQCSATVVVQDNVPPVITLPQGVANGDTLRVQCYGQDPTWDLPVFNANSITAIDECGGNIVVVFNENLVNEGNCGVDGYINLYRLRWTATDACGNSSVAVAFMALVDTIAPVIHGVPGDTIVNCDQIPLLPTLVFATDECLCACVILFEETEVSASSGCQDGHVITRTWTATDRCGNETIAQQRITLIDTTGPKLQIMQRELSGLQSGSILVYNCSTGGIPAFFDTLSVASVMSPATCGGIGTMSFDSRSVVSRNCEFFGYVEQRTYHWTALDECGNKTDLTIIAQLLDDVAPTIVGLPAMACVGDPALNDVEAIDECGNASLRFWETEVRNPCGEGMAVRRTYEAFDDCGNITRDTVMLIPNDLELPVISFSNSSLGLVLNDDVLTVSCNANGQQYTSYGAGDAFTTGGCGVTVSFEEKLLANGDCVQDGYVALLSLIWTATDVCGNHSQQTMLAEVVDTTSPVFINFKPVISIGCHDTLPQIFTSDNCGGVVMTSIDSIIPGKCKEQYDVQRRITVSDPCGNTATRVQLVHVGNGGGPVIEGVVENVCDDVSIPVVTAYDACAGVYVDVTMVQDTLEFYCHDGLVIQRIWSATDACGNTRVIKQIIILHDVTPPEILVPSYSVINLFVDRDDNLVLLSQTDIMKKLDALNESSVYVLDDCDQHIEIVFTADTLFALNCEASGYAERRTYMWVATDVCGNSDSLSFTVDIMDDLPPIMNEVPADTLYVCQELPPMPNMLSETPKQYALVVVSQTMIPGSGPGEFDVTRQWVATDSCHNASTLVQHILWIPQSQIQCNIILPDTVQCNSHGVLISSFVTGGFAPYTYVWQIVGEKCFIQAGQGTPDIEIYVGWAEVTIILTITDRYGCVSTCTATVNCYETFGGFTSSPSNISADNSEATMIPTFHTIWNQDQEDHVQQITYWPNPASETMNLGFESTIDQELKINLVNLLNQVVLKENIVVGKGYNVIPINVSRVPDGSYLLEIKTGTEMHSKVVVILRDE